MFNYSSLLVNIIFGVFISSVGFAQQSIPPRSLDSLSALNTDEMAFITKSGCKIIPTTYYCLSEGRYYFAVGDKKNYYYIDTLEVQAYQNIEIGKDQEFATKKRAGFNRRIWVGTVIVGGPFAVALGAGGMFLIGVAANDPLDGGLFFAGGLAMGTTIFYKVLKTAIINVSEHNAYKEAKPYMCS